MQKKKGANPHFPLGFASSTFKRQMSCSPAIFSTIQHGERPSIGEGSATALPVGEILEGSEAGQLRR